MKIIISISALFYVLLVQANCELYSEGYHTIADYLDEEGTLKNNLFLPFIFNDPYYVVKTEFKRSYFKQIETHKIDPKKISFGSDETCKESPKSEIITSFYTGLNSMRFKTCQNYVPPASPQQGWAIYEKDISKLMLPIHLKGELLVTQTDASKKIETSIDDYLAGSSFKASKNILLPKGSFKPVKFDHFKFNESFYSTTVKVEHTSMNSFLAVFLTYKDTTWYIADSGGLDHCGRESKLEGLSGQNLGWIANMKSGWDYNGDGLPEIINFESPDIFYFMDFGKKLLVIKKTDSRVSMYLGEELGLQSDKR